MNDELLLLDPISPPRRYSIDEYKSELWLGPRLRVFLDGVEQEQVVAYDCDAGWVFKNSLGPDGLARLTDRGDEVLRETVRGQVTVGWREESHA